MITLSNSSISSFITCPTKYYWEYVRKIEPIQKSFHLVYGEIVHAGLARMFKGMMKGVNKEDCIDSGAGLIRQMWTALVPGTVNVVSHKTLDSALWFLTEIAGKNFEDRGEIIAVESMIDRPLIDDITYRGKTDLILKEFDGLVIYDWKTSSYSIGNDNRKLSLNRALKGYRWLSGTLGEVYDARIVPLLIDKRKNTRSVGEALTSNPCPGGEVDLWEQETIAIAQAIQGKIFCLLSGNNEFFVDANSLFPRYSTLCQENFITCDFLSLCRPGIKNGGRLEEAYIDPNIYQERKEI